MNAIGGAKRLVVRGARVLDPETRLDALRDVAVANGRIEAVAERISTLADDEVLDARGLVLAPGFIDVHSHSDTVAGLRLQAQDGVTTALELEVGALPVALAYERATAEGRPVNVGFSASWSTARMLALGVVTTSAGTMADFADHVGCEAWGRSATAPEVDTIVHLLGDELDAGALGVGLMTGFAPGVEPAEIEAVGHLVAARGAPTFSHIRAMVETDPEVPIDGVIELVEVARRTGAHMHLCHVNSVATRHVDRALDTIARGRAEGLQVTTEAYPYGYGMTNLGAPFFTPEGLRTRGLRPEDLVYARTAETIESLDRLAELRRTDPAGLVFTHNLRTETEVDKQHLLRALCFEDGLIASDAMPLIWPEGGARPWDWPMAPGIVTHPRTAGCFSRAVRELVGGGSMSLLEMVRRCTLLPANLLDGVAPALRHKGRVQVGCDADLVLFDPSAVSDQATFADSTRASTGFSAVLVNGEFVVNDGEVVPDSLPGRPVRGRQASSAVAPA